MPSIAEPGMRLYYGFIHGFDRSLAPRRPGHLRSRHVPHPDPDDTRFCTKKFPADPVYPDSYRPGLISDALFDTDTYTGFSGGDIAPFVPGSRFSIFDN